MTKVSFIQSKYMSLSSDQKRRVHSYMPAIAGRKLASLKPLAGFCSLIDDCCQGTSTEGYFQCMVDAITLTLAKPNEATVVYNDSSVDLARMLSVQARKDTIDVCLRHLGIENYIDISSETVDGLFEDPEEDAAASSLFSMVDSKQVEDSDGFSTDYTWYRTIHGTHVFIFGDNELYDPSNTSPDYECESEEEARAWFNSYGEPEDSLDEDFEEWTGEEESCDESQSSEHQSKGDGAPAEKEEEDDSTETESDNKSDFEKDMMACFGGTIPNYVSKILNIYDLLYSSGFDLRRPYGVVGEQGIYHVDRANHSVVRCGATDMDFGTSIKVYSLFRDKLGFSEKQCRSAGVIGMEIVSQYMQNPSVVMYFPQKCLEIMHGRVPATASKEARGEKIVYFSPSKSMNSWAEYKKNDVKPHLEQLLLACVRVYLEKSGLKDEMRTLKAVNAVQGLLSYAVSCLTTGVLLIDYRTAKGSPVKFKIRVSDPTGKLDPSADYAPEIIQVAFAGNGGGKESKRIKGGLDERLSAAFKVYEYAHEFDHTASNAMPLFAYKALEALQARGETVTWKNAILGQAMDDTILKNGSGGIDLSKALFHHINAGSRSGKGVMTLNMLASGIASGKALFYLDNKVDMGSMLASLAHNSGQNAGSVNGPDMFVVNGSNFEKDDFGEFSHRDNWVIQANIPQEVRHLFGSSSWNTLGELFYLRAYMLCLGIIFARGSDTNGKLHDPMFGGESGLMVIVDEINQVQTRMLALSSIMADVVPPLDSEYQNRIDAIKLAAESQKEAVKLPKLVRSFKRQFSGSAYYALSLLKSYADCIQSIKNKSFSGFRDAEASASDIFVIGQNLEPIPVGDLGDVLKTSRYKNDSDVGLNKMSNGGNKVRTQSIPYQMLLFKSADAFIGYNGPQPSYLMQTDDRSKAFGVLDRTARGFAYVPLFATPADGEKPALQFSSLSKANDSNTVYFRPYLILNDGSMGSSYVQDMFKYAGEAGAPADSVIAEYPDEEDPNAISRNVGFHEYMKMLGLDNLPARLQKGAEIANHVVANYLGYTGVAGSTLPLWLQFVTDLRPAWIFSPQDIWAKCTNNPEFNIGKGINSKVTGEYYQYVKDLAELQLMGIDVSDPSLTPSVVSGGDGSFSFDDISEFERQAGMASDEDGLNPLEELDFETQRMKDAMGDRESVDSEDLFVDDLFEEPAPKGGFDIFDFNPENAEGSYTGESVTPSPEGSAGYAWVSETMSKSNMEAIEQALELLRNNGYNVSLDMGGYSVNPDGRVVTEYSPAESSSDVGDIFASAGDVDSPEDFELLVNNLTFKVIHDFGGLARIRSFAIVGDSIVINNVMYRCKIDKSLCDRLYVDLRREVNAGNICRLFNYKMLAGMTNLTELRFDSARFMYDYVNYGAFGVSDVPLRAYFDALPQLSLLQVGSERYTRQSVLEEDTEAPYYVKCKTAKFFDCVKEKTKSWNQDTWSWGKSKLTDKNSKWYQKVLWAPFVMGAAGATVVMRGASAGISAVTTAADKESARQNHEKKVGGFVDSFKRGFRGLKAGLSDLFSDE